MESRDNGIQRQVSHPKPPTLSIHFPVHLIHLSSSIQYRQSSYRFSSLHHSYEHLRNTALFFHLVDPCCQLQSADLPTSSFLQTARRETLPRNDLEQVDLSRSAVRGKLTAAWRGCCQRLRSLKLSVPWSDRSGSPEGVWGRREGFGGSGGL